MYDFNGNNKGHRSPSLARYPSSTAVITQPPKEGHLKPSKGNLSFIFCDLHFLSFFFFPHLQKHQIIFSFYV